MGQFEETLVTQGVADTQRVRVVILNYNQPDMTARCVSYVIAQSYTTLDIVVVDNASTVENYEALQRSLPEHVTLVRNSANSGYAAGNNLGARLSGTIPPSTYTMILNGDAFLRDTDTIKKLVDGLRKDPDRVAITPLVNTGVIELAPEQQIQVCRAASYAGFLVAYSWWLRKMPVLKSIADRHFYKERMPYVLDREYDCETLHGCCFVIRTDFLESIDYFDEGTFLYFEEMILGRQIKDRGKGCCLLTSVVVDHMGGAATRKRTLKGELKVQMELIKSQLYYCRKYLHVGMAARGLLVVVRTIGFIGKEIYHAVIGSRRAERGMSGG